MLKHFDECQWKLYAEGGLDEEAAAEMESHLLECNDCLEIYLRMIEDNGMESTEAMVSPQFTDNVMKKIQHEKKSYTFSKKQIFFYYVVAACITLFLTFNGAFDSLYSRFTESSSQIAQSSGAIEKMFVNGWSERLTNEAVIAMDRLKQKKTTSKTDKK
ncbi:MAG: hypothetical protein N2645_02800 [Clostridia bacterium]|nr:hypothetical protein [Clostridia bacterium]